LKGHIIYIGALRVGNVTIAYEDESYPDLRLAGEVAQSVNIGQIEAPIAPPARIPSYATAIKTTAVYGSTPEKVIAEIGIARFGANPIPEKHFSSGCTGQVKWPIDHPGFGIIGIVTTARKATSICPAAYAPTAVGARVRSAIALTPIVFAVAGNVI